MTDIPNEVNRHTHAEQTGKLHSTNFLILFENIDFQRSKGVFMFSEQNYKFAYVLSWIFSMTKCGITVAKMCKIIVWIFFNALSQSQPSNMLYFCYIPHHPPPPHPHTHIHISDCQHVFLLLRKSLRHLGGWFSIIHKFARDLILVDLVPDFDTISFIAMYFWVALLQINFVCNGKQKKTVFIF